MCENRSRRLSVIWKVWKPPIERPAIARCSRSGIGPEGRIDERDQGIGDVRLEGRRHLLHHPLARFRRGRRRGAGRARGRLAGAPRVAIGHHHDHRFGLALGDQVVEDEVRAPLPDPAGLVFPAAVLQVEHGIAHLDLRVVAGRQVDQRVAPATGRLRRVPDLTDLPVGHVLDRIVVGASLRHLDGAGVPAPTEERVAAGVGELGAIDDHR